MRGFSFIVTIAVFAAPILSASVAQAAEPIVLKPSSPWNLDYAEEYCALRRAFEHNGKKLILEFRQYRPGRRFDIVVMGEGRRFRGSKFDFRFSPHERVLGNGYAFGMESKNGYRGVFSSGQFGPRSPSRDANDGDQPEVTQEALDQWASGVERLEILRGFGKVLSIETGPLDATLSALDTCLDELVTHWGIDAEAAKSNIRRATPKDQRIWARKLQEVYPSKALRNGNVGPVQVRMIVGPDGRVSQCRSLNTFTNSLLDESACKGLVQHARFEPALNASGEPVTGYYMTTVVYRLN